VKKTGIKYHKASLEFIQQFNKSKKGILSSKKGILDSSNAKFKSFKKNYKIEFEYNRFAKKSKHLILGKYYKGIQIKFGETPYILENVYLGSHSPPIFTGTIDRIRSIGFSEKSKYYFQLIIPLEKELKFLFNIEHTYFKTDLGYGSTSSVTANIKGEQIQACCIHQDKKKYFLAIDSTYKQTFDEFAEKANTLKIALGYFSGYYAGNRGYFFAHTKMDMKHPKHFRCLAYRDSIKSGYQPVYSNAYGYLPRSPLAKKYQPLLRPVTIKEFSVLCEKIYSSLDFASMIMLILESSVASLLFMPGGYAIAIETISDLIIDKKKLKLAPIHTKPAARKIRKELIEVLEKNSATISSIATLKKRVDNINQPTNKARLKAPFELLGIDLVEEDLKILETRNDFLHGKTPDLTKSGPDGSTNRINKDLFYCSMRFYILLNLLILKLIGYDNKIVNYPKIHEGYTEIKLDEEPYRQV
jgi:hypothetical protein